MDELAIEVRAPGEGEPDSLAIPFPEGTEGTFSNGALELDGQLKGRLQRLADSGELKGDLGTAVVLHTDGELNARRVVVAGIGKTRRARRRRIAHRRFEPSRTGVARRRRHARRGCWTSRCRSRSRSRLARSSKARCSASYTPARWKTQERSRTRASSGSSSGHGRDDGACGEREPSARRVAEWVNARATSRTSPPNELDPRDARRARAGELAGEHEAPEVEALGPARIDELGMGALAAVGRGSSNGPRLIVLRYEPPQAARKDLVLGLVGKAITFDAGGISLKPAAEDAGHEGRHGRRRGTCRGMGAVAELELPVRIVAVVAAAENLPGGDAFRPGDILRAANGKTIEIIEHRRRRTARARRRALVRAARGRDARARPRDADGRDGARARRLLRRRSSRTTTTGATEILAAAEGAATTRGRSRSIPATGATSTPRSPT